jgi:hypothetical protein
MYQLPKNLVFIYCRLYLYQNQVYKDIFWQACAMRSKSVHETLKNRLLRINYSTLTEYFIWVKFFYDAKGLSFKTNPPLKRLRDKIAELGGPLIRSANPLIAG